MSSELMTVTQYARHRGVKPEAVRYAISVGKISARSLVFKTEGGPPYVKTEAADGEWILEIRETKTQVDAPKSSSKKIDWDDVQKNSDKLQTIADSRAKKEAADAALAELKLAKERGKLVDAEEMKQASFKAARMTRDAMLNIPDRVAAELAVETDAFRIHRRLTDEIRQALEGLNFGADE